MALAGDGAICIWNGITPEGRDAFYDWHLHEHMPERAAIPGFRRGRRFVALDAATAPEFFTLYETENEAVLTSPAYLARLNDPTPYTKSATKGFRETARALTRVAASFGPGPGGILATVRYAAGPSAAAVSAALRDTVLPGLAKLPQITGVHLCETDVAASGAKTAESRGRDDIGAAPERVVLVEGCNAGPVDAALAMLLAAPGFAAAGPSIVGRYRLEYLRMPTDRG